MSSDLIIRLAIYIASFVAIWIGAGLIVRTITKFSYRLHMSSFTVSFVLLGLLTSIPEFAVGMNAIALKEAEIFVGNLLGGIIVLFLLIIPILAILGNGIKLRQSFSQQQLLLILAVIATPAFLILDRRVGNYEALFMILFYLLGVYIIQRRPTVTEAVEQKIFKPKISYATDLGKAGVGAVIVFISSQAIVSQTEYFSGLLNIAPFYLSLILLSLGTNLPELSLAVRSIMHGKKDVAFGDYLGSAAVNTLLFGVFSLLTQGDVFTSRDYLSTFIFLILGLVLFYFFARSRNTVSRTEGFVLLLLYVVFLWVELV
ncbi:MAG: sodium:calcium antiporter [Weeksellaceae bacterium]